MFERSGLLALLAVLSATALCSAVPSAAAPGTGTRSAAGSGSPELNVLLSLSGRKEHALEAYVRAVSNPASPRYRAYLTLRQLVERFGAPRRHRMTVLAYLRAHGLEGRVDPTGSFVSVRIPAGKAEALFETVLVPTRAAAGRQALKPSHRPAIPRELVSVVDGVVGLDTRPLVTQHAETPPATISLGASGRQRTGTPAGCADGQNASSQVGVPGFTPNQWLTAYGSDRLHARGLSGRGQRVAVVETDGFVAGDLQAAGACFGYRPPRLRLILAGIDEPLAPGLETTLDLQVIAAVAPGLEEIQVYQSGPSLGELLLLFVEPLAQPPGKRPHVVSSSLGACEPSYSGAPVALDLSEQLFRAYAALGITVVSAAGDTGSSDCALDGNASALGLLSVDYPGSSPFVTSVGGTNITLTAANRIASEVVWNDNPITLPDGSRAFGGAGGGGQSFVFRRPWWQRGPGVTGPRRLVPDVALLADLAPGYAVYCSAGISSRCRDSFVSVGGTSAAAPLLAASIALANEDAARRGQPRLGLINPLLYAIGNTANTVYRDIVEGSNDVGRFLPEEAGGGEPLGCCAAGVGWDRASGWGSIDMAAFSSAARAAYDASRG